MNNDDIKQCAVMALIDVMGEVSILENEVSQRRISLTLIIEAIDSCIDELNEAKKAIEGVVEKAGFNSRNTQSHGISRGQFFSRR